MNGPQPGQLQKYEKWGRELFTQAPLWITPLVNYLLSKKKEVDGKGYVDKVIALSLKACKLIGGNQRNWGRNGAQGNLHWWRMVHNNTLSKQKSQTYLES